ncbi:MAG TPA: hypothetical protein PK725_08840 [Rhodocyclaceae bacterium]|nr:hypothetical protein [Rhodocyclaceae bacterium]HRQ47044.1 hypothetical protein [Rhodocyclaceae bacterium]
MYHNAGIRFGDGENDRRLPLRRTADLFEPIWRLPGAEIRIRRFIEGKT